MLGDLAVAAAGGLVATMAMEPVTKMLYERASRVDRQRERRVSPGVPYRVAAEKMSGWLGLAALGPAARSRRPLLHYGLGIGWAPLYVLLRRWWRMPAPQAGIVTGLALFAIVDEGQPDHWLERPTAGLSAVDPCPRLRRPPRVGVALAAAVESASILLRQARRG